MLLNGPSLPLKSLMGLGALGGDAIATLAAAVAAFFAGEVLDASRDLLEDLWDWLTQGASQDIKWDFFTDAEQNEVEKLRTSFFTYYVFDCNVSLALVILLISDIFTNLLGSFSAVVFSLVFLAIFVWNARRLRSQIASRTQRWAGMKSPA
jgi:hypothetical protein